MSGSSLPRSTMTAQFEERLHHLQAASRPFSSAALHPLRCAGELQSARRPPARCCGRVVAVCSSTAALIAADTVSISLIVVWIAWIASTDCLVIACIEAICCDISSVAARSGRPGSSPRMQQRRTRDRLRQRVSNT